MKGTFGILACLALFVVLMFLWWDSPDKLASNLEAPREAPSRSAEPASRSESAPLRSADAVMAEEESAEASQPVGIEAWRAIYKERMASHIIETYDSESGWQDDPVAVEEFRKLMKERMAALSLEPMDEATRERVESLQQEAESLIQEFHGLGLLEGMASGTTRALEPSEIATLANTLRTMRRKQDEALPKDWILDSPGLFLLSPSRVMKRLGVSLEGRSRRQELEQIFLQKMTPWMFADAEKITLSGQARHLAMEQGILPPSRSWLPDILPRYGELEKETTAYEEQMRQVYRSYLPAEGK